MDTMSPLIAFLIAALLGGSAGLVVFGLLLLATGKVSLKRKTKNGKPSLWEAIKILWTMETDIKKIEKKRVSSGRKKKKRTKS